MRLKVRSGADAGRKAELEGEHLTLGREPGIEMYRDAVADIESGEPVEIVALTSSGRRVSGRQAFE